MMILSGPWNEFVCARRFSVLFFIIMVQVEY